MADGCVNWPERTGSYKFVQLYVDEKPFLRLGNTNTLHGELLAQCLDSLEVPYKLTRSPLTRAEVPEIKGERYEAVGMGIAIVMSGSKKTDFHGSSADYQITPNRDHLKLIQELYPEWTLSIK